MAEQTTTTLAHIAAHLPSAMDYETYRGLVRQLAEEGGTTGPEQTAALVEYTQLNDRRMKRWDKTLKIPEAVAAKIAKVKQKITFLVLSESWCGDAAPSIPAMQKIAELNPNIELKILLRDSHLEVMDCFLTNGGRSIPKLVILDQEKQHIHGSWGPRPSKATAMAEAYKAEHGKLSPAFKQDLQLWYNKDKGQNILEDLVALLPLE